MRPEGKVQVVVRSRKVPIGTAFRNAPIYSMSGVLLGSQPKRVVLYGTSLDEEHQRTIEEAQRLACTLGLGLEVVDEAESGFFTRLLSRLGRNPSYPSILVSSTPGAAPADTSSALAHGG